MRLPFIKAPLAVFLNERQVEKSGGVNKKNFEGSQKSPGRRKVGREMVLLSACQGLCHWRETVESDSRSQLIPAPEPVVSLNALASPLCLGRGKLCNLVICRK